jgi:hypothetical protein
MITELTITELVYIFREHASVVTHLNMFNMTLLPFSHWMRGTERDTMRDAEEQDEEAPYSCAGRIETGVDKAVYSLEFSPDGDRLVCGGKQCVSAVNNELNIQIGEFGIHIVDVEMARRRKKNRPPFNARVYGAVVTLKWMGDMLVIGTMYGYISIWADRNDVCVPVSALEPA